MSVVVRKRRLVGDEVAQFEQRIIQAPAWHPGRKYVAGWSDERDVVLLYRDEHGDRQTELVTDFPWYFYMRTDDALRVPKSVWREWRERGVFERLDVDPVSSEWTRVYAVRRVTQTQWLKDHGEMGVGLDVLDDVSPRYPDRPANWTRFEPEKRLHEFLVVLHAHGWTYEADLTPRQRFMTDRLVEIDQHYNELFLDIETDDSVPDWQHKERWRHLAYSLVLRERDGTEERHSFLLDRETDGAERAMLRALVPLLDRADIVYAWNGKPFDFPLMRARFKYHGIDYDWRHVVWCDLIAVWRRYHSRSAVTSFALDVLAPKVLGRPKLDWRAESERLGRRADRMIDLYRWHPELCQRYNENDTELLYELERTFGYAAADRAVGRLGNCFPSDPYVGSKVDAILLNRGAGLGHHYLTRGLQLDALPPELAARARASQRKADDAEDPDERPDVTYAGAYVFPSVAGYHEGVAALDFKSLYPTTMVLFNISPETWVPASERATHDSTDLTTTPSGATFRRRDDGVIPLVFRETLEQRKVYTRRQLAEVVGSESFKRYERIAYAFKVTGLSVAKDSIVWWGNADGIHRGRVECAWEDIVYGTTQRGDVAGVDHSTREVAEVLPQAWNGVRRQRRVLGLDGEGGTRTVSEDMGAREREAGPCGDESVPHVRSRAMRSPSAPLAWYEPREHDGCLSKRTTTGQGEPMFAVGEAPHQRQEQGVVGSAGLGASPTAGGAMRGAVSGPTCTGKTTPTNEGGSARALSTFGGSCSPEAHERRAMGSRLRVDGALEVFDAQGLGYVSLSIDGTTGLAVLAPIAYLIRHRVGTVGMVRVTLDRGESVTVTEDHSLLVRRGTILYAVRPRDVRRGDEMLALPAVHDRAFRGRIVDKIEAVLCASDEYVYDVEIDQAYSAAFVANGVLVHNSFYGSLGHMGSRYYNPEVAEAVTLTGQWFEKRTAELAERRGYRVLLGDTDSIYLPMTEAQARAFVAECAGYYREIVREFNVDVSRFMMELEFENYFSSLIVTTKKRYAGLLTFFKGKAADHVEVKGLECMRSDWPDRARVFQRRLLELILRRRRPPIADVVALVESERDAVLSGALTVDEISLSQSIEKPLDTYKTQPPHVRVARHIRDTTNEFYQGMRVAYVMVPGPIDPAKPWKKVDPAPVWTRDYVEGSYDRYHAWSAKVWPPTCRVLGAVYPEHDWAEYAVETPRPNKPTKKATKLGKNEGFKKPVIIRRRSASLSK